MEEKPYKGFVIWHLLWSNLGVRPLRSALSVAGALPSSVSRSVDCGPDVRALCPTGARAPKGVGADIIVQPPNSSIFFAFSSAVMPESLVGQDCQPAGSRRSGAGADRRRPEKSWAWSTALITTGLPGSATDSRFFRAGHSSSRTRPSPTISPRSRASCAWAKRRFFSATNSRSPASCCTAKGARFFIPIKTAQDIAGADGRVSMFYVRSKGDTEAARNELVKLLPTYKIRSMAEFSTLMTSSNLPELKPFIRSFVMLGVVISFLVVLLTMHTMVFERTRDIGVLRALGSSRLEICWMILGETLVMVALGVVCGLLCTYSVVAILHRTSPTLQIAIEGGWIVRAILLTIGGAIAGATVSRFARRAKRSCGRARLRVI